MTTSKIVGLHPGFYVSDSGEIVKSWLKPSALGASQRVLVLSAEDGTEAFLTARVAAWLMPEIAKLISNEFRAADPTDSDQPTTPEIS
jgi:hypothetical protein